MKLSETEIKGVIDFVKKEPKTIQEVSKLINKSWVTTETYLKEIKSKTGAIDIKAFRQGSKSGLKIAYYNHKESASTDQVKEELFRNIKKGREKTDFDFMDLFQLISSKKSKISAQKEKGFSETKELIKLFQMAEDHIYCFSGNMSFINLEFNKTRLLNLMETALKRKVHIKILCRVNLASVQNINKLSKLLTNYSEFLEIRHSYHPLRGFIIDGKLARFKNFEKASKYRGNELEENLLILYELYDESWIIWLEKVFWNIFRTAGDYKTRLTALKKMV